jgi:DedD protein
LIGAAVLLGVGVIGFPLVFETQPRPIPVDIPIEIPRKDGAPSLPLPPPRTASTAPAVPARTSSGVTTNEPARAAVASAPAAPRAEPQARSEPAPRSEPALRSESAARTEPAPSPTPKPAPAKPEASSGDDGARARALLEGQSAQGKTTVAAAEPNRPAAVTKAEPTKPDAAGSRFIVQVGSYGEASSARDMRQRVDKLGLKSYTQAADVDGKKRIRVRVGPFNSREDAEKAAGTLKAAGLPAAIQTL